MADLANYLKKSRESVGLSQTFVSSKLGYSSPQFVSNWERGLSHPPLKSLKKIAKLYKLKDKELFDVFVKTYVSEVEKDLRKKIQRIKA
ncbi:MAG: helix-turn-helix domain-containing protein [Bdellovibrionales bacterium]